MIREANMSNEKGAPWLFSFFFQKGIILYRPIYVGILIINHYKDPVIKQSIFYGSRIRLVFFFRGESMLQGSDL